MAEIYAPSMAPPPVPTPLPNEPAVPLTTMVDGEEDEWEYEYSKTESEVRPDLSLEIKAY